MTIVDALDTLYMMGLKDEFNECVSWIDKSLRFDKGGDVSVFETTIRILGGLLSAFDLSGEDILLRKADEIGTRLLPAFRTASGVPYTTINLATGIAHNPGWSGGASILAEAGTVQIEFRSLAWHTKKPEYAAAVNRAMDALLAGLPPDGLCPSYVPISDGHCRGGPITFGALGDSFYEYELKQYLHGGRKDIRYREAWDRAIESMMQKLIRKTPSGLTYVGEMTGSFNAKMDHLACFLPGNLALGAEGPRYEAYMSLAKELGRTCHEMYARQRSGLSPEFVTFNPEMSVGAAYYILRPETLEAFFYLWRFTGDAIYKEWAWDVFQALEKNCRVASGGYVGIRDVNGSPPSQDDLMQSFFLAETLKYLFLMFAPESTLDLDHWVINTEAHPLRVLP